ncbi:MAG: hypothetical protein GY788_26765 [bacterium]|nr:hypothetical protein [bacterium]
MCDIDDEGSAANDRGTAGRLKRLSLAVMGGGVEVVAFGLPGGRLLSDLYDAATIERRQEALTLEDRIDLAASQLSQSADNFRVIEEQLSARRDAVETLREEAEAAEALAGTHQSQLDAVATVLRGEFSHSERRSFRQALLLTGSSFVAGVVATVIVALAFS